jgi:hypothetical protein
VKVPRSQIYRAAQHVPRRWIGEALSMGGCQVINTENLTIITTLFIVKLPASSL